MKRVLTLVCVALFASLDHASAAGLISGTIKGPDGAPLRAVFVRAEHETTRITTIVLSNNQGRYVIDNLVPGTYQVWATALGFRGEPVRLTGVTVADGRPVTVDFTMQKSAVLWSQLTRYQMGVLLPEAKGKETFLANCSNCHGMSKITGRRDYEGWLDAIDVMRRVGVTTIPPTIAQEVASYLAAVLGPDSPTPQSPQDLPQWETVKQQVSDEALNIVYVDYNLTGATRDRPGTGYPDRRGNVWSEAHNGLIRLNPITGEVKSWRMEPEQGAVHEVLPLPDGTVWLTITNANKLARFDTRTEKFDIFPHIYDGPRVKQIDANTPWYGSPKTTGGMAGPNGTMAGPRKHTATVDLEGNIWATGRPLTKFNIKTQEFTDFADVPDVYGIATDKQGNIWFAEFNGADYGSIGMVEAKTGKVSKWKPPHPNGRPRRLKIDSQGNVWFGQYFANRIGRFDPETQTFKEYTLPGPMGTVYGLGIDHNDNIWYVSHFADVTGRIDPRTDKIIEYPTPYGDRGTRDLWPDAQGRMWYGAQPWNKVGYFYLRTAATGGRQE